jgi:hypothetical protein
VRVRQIVFPVSFYDSDYETPFKMGHKAKPCAALQELQHPQILVPELSSLDKMLNTKLDSDQSQSQTNRESASPCSANLSSPHSQEYNEHVSISTSRDRRSTHDFDQGTDYSAPSLRRGRSSRRISVRETKPNNFTLILELLPWIAGLIWITNQYIGIQ